MSSTRVRTRPFVTHDEIPSSKANRLVEAELTTQLNDIVNKIKDQLNPVYAWTELQSIYKPKYQDLVADTIRQATTKSYLLGAEFASTSISTNPRIPIFLTESDAARIKEIAIDGSERFWGRMMKSTSRGADKVFFNIQRNQTPPDSFLNPNYIVNTIAIDITNIALNIATITKRRDLIQKYSQRTVGISNESSGSSSTTILPLQQDNREPNGAGRRLLSQSQFTDNTPVGENPITDPRVNRGILFVNPDFVTVVDRTVSWITSQDDRVCNICEAWEFKTWYIDDPFMAIPGLHSHENCRCRLIPLGI